MCLILFAWQSHPRYRLVLAANRDEFHDRPTAAADYWPDSPDLLAGRDLQAGGTWLGVTRQGRFSAITNYREPANKEPLLEHSRGHLVRDFLLAKTSSVAFADSLQKQGALFRGFNLLLGDTDRLTYISNRNEDMEIVKPGIHGLSNHLLNTDWPKVQQGRERLKTLLDEDRIDPEALLEVLAASSAVSDCPPTDSSNRLVAENLNRLTFITSPEYGTRSSTVLLQAYDGKSVLVERQFDASGRPSGTQSHEFTIV